MFLSGSKIFWNGIKTHPREKEGAFWSNTEGARSKRPMENACLILQYDRARTDVTTTNHTCECVRSHPSNLMIIRQRMTLTHPVNACRLIDQHANQSIFHSFFWLMSARASISLLWVIASKKKTGPEENLPSSSVKPMHMTTRFSRQARPLPSSLKIANTSFTGCFLLNFDLIFLSL